MTNVSYVDQLDLFNPRDWVEPVHLIGLGGIGSALVLPLVKLGVDVLHFWDIDTIEPKNVPGQLIYSPADVGRPKIEVAAEVVAHFAPDATVHLHDQWYDGSEPLEGVVIAGVDSMASRRLVWSGVRMNPRVRLFMDGRVGGLQSQLQTLDPRSLQKVEEYESTLFDDSEAVELPCSARSIAPSPLWVATWATAHLTLFAQGKLPQQFRAENLGSAAR